jgi:hypothetical protein
LFDDDSSDCEGSDAEAVAQLLRCKRSLPKPAVDSASCPASVGASFFHYSAFGVFLRDAGKFCNQHWYWLAVWYLRFQVLMAVSAVLWGVTNAAILSTQGATAVVGQSIGAFALKEAVGRYLGVQRNTVVDSIASTLAAPATKPWRLHAFSDCLQFAVSWYYTLGQYVL